MACISCCECCASKDDLVQFSLEEYAVTILNCFAIQIELGDEKHICKMCIEKLGEANNFRNEILNTQDILRDRKDNVYDAEDNNISLPKQEYDDHFETTDDFEPFPIKVEFDTNRSESTKNDLVFDYLNSSPDLIIKPIRRPKLTKLQALKIGSIPNNIEKAKKRTRAIKVKKLTAPDVLKLALDYRGTKKLKVKEEKFVMPKLDDKDFICHECQKQFPTYRLLFVHMNEHYRNFICETCGKGFITKRRLDVHTRSHSETKCVCNECGKQFNSPNSLSSHKQRKHAGLQLHKCPICAEKFEYFYKKMKHLAEVHGQTEEKYKCKFCSMTFLVASSLSAHVRRKHSIRERRHACTTCGAAYFHKKSLREHMTVHTGSRDFKCHLCPKAYPRKYTLREHMRIHENDKRFRCEVCGRAFTQKCTLKGHMKVHEKEAVTMRTFLNSHMRKRHLVRKRSHICEICGAAYYEKKELSGHMTSHTGDRPFQCPQCPKAYPRKKTLREHMRIHDNDKRFSCEVCGRAFTQKCTLKGHMKVHEK